MEKAYLHELKVISYFMKNHLFVGLGGFGGRTLAHLRKTTYINEQLSGEKIASNANLSYLYCDTSEDIHSAKELWTTLGSDESLDPVDFLNFRDGKVPISFENMENIPHVTEWLGSEKDIEKYLVGMGAATGANQRRRFGRFLFACNASRFLDRVRKRATVSGQTEECTFHLFATFAGGTGSGSLIDAIIAIRNAYPDDKTHPIFVYGYCTARDQDGDKHDVGFFYPNQYSVIRDLNGLLIGKYKPRILTVPDRKVEPNSRLVHVSAVYLNTPLNEGNESCDPEKQTETVANWLYQKIRSEIRGELPPELQKAFTGEDILAEAAGEKELGATVVRSWRFGSLGINKWEIPEDETIKALTLDFSEQALNQFLFNTWDKKLGFVEAGPKNYSQNYLKEFRYKTDSIYTLSEGTEHPSFEKEWRSFIDKYPPAENLETSIKTLLTAVDKHHRKGFRSHGVENHFKQEANTRIPQEVRDFKKFLTERLDTLWFTKESGVESLVESLKELEAFIDGKRSSLTQVAEKESQSLTEAIDSLRLKWLRKSEDIGWAARAAKVEHGMYKRFSEEVFTIYNSETVRTAVTQYASLLFLNLKEMVISVRTTLVKTQSSLTDIRRLVRIEREPLIKQNNVPFIEFKREDVEDVWRAMRKDDIKMPNYVDSCRNKLKLKDKSLMTLHLDTATEVMKLLRSEASRQVSEIHDHALNNNSELAGQKILGRNIWEIFTHDNLETLKPSIQKFLGTAHTLARRSQERAQVGNGKILEKQSKIIFNPEFTSSDGRGLERTELFKAFEASNDSDAKLEFPTHKKDSSLICLSVKAAMPARFFTVVQDLSQRYHQVRNEEDVKYFSHLDQASEEEDGLPDLFQKKS